MSDFGEKRAWLSRWLPLGLWMGMIFAASTDAMSSAHTSRFLVPLLRWLKPDISPVALDWTQLIVRKCAHVTEYAILACWFWRARHKPSVDGSPAWSNRDARNAILFGCIYAMSDEFHQYFVASREASIRDVTFDTLGATLGMVAIWVVGRMRRRW